MTELDLDVVQYVLSSLKRAAEHGGSWPVSPGEAAALVAEVDRLRAQRVLDNEEAARLYDFARDKGAALERDATVAYLLKGTADCKECMDEAVVRLAREIERGDHRREEEP
jgi:hypothetical protein